MDAFDAKISQCDFHYFFFRFSSKYGVCSGNFLDPSHISASLQDPSQWIQYAVGAVAFHYNIHSDVFRYKHHILKILKKNNLHQYFRGNITSCTGDIPYKPFKNGYVIGYKKLGLKASEVLVIEDSDVGIEAALKANVQKVLRHTNNDKNLPKNIKYRIPKLMGYKDFDKRF